jgi:hypothetical protein
MNGVRGVAVWESFRAGAGGFDSGAHPEWAEHLRPGSGATESRGCRADVVTRTTGLHAISILSANGPGVGTPCGASRS